ncbi:multi-sensor hybrid histidine kinase [Magnetococcus marinus MC-1]|uniref:histidine kinase n=1 Tax=Magnetococcus marinus (strain ATCC BAA-1437 / JCM 17883 / MC-1) TaxID=156889 RepID=A0LD10_MAGMM|nr:hybrid sensor histidine kinase/response regulator [Magnetococcus marinus]ABK45853.1 multi-sensor hybrid histidine kinase [Magnetococcus marinus MC-1]
MKLSHKFILTLLPPILLALFGLGWWHHHTTMAEVTKANERYLQTLLDGFMENALQRRFVILQENNLNDIASFVQTYRREIYADAERIAQKHEVQLIIYDTRGNVQYATSKPITKQPPIELKQLLLPDSTGRLTALPPSGDEATGALYLQQGFSPWRWQILLLASDAQLTAAVRNIRHTTLLVAALLTAAFILLVYGLLRHLVLQPVALLRQASKCIAHHEPLPKLPLTEGDEISHLAIAIAAMSRSIGEYHRHLQTQRNRFETLLAANPDLISLKNRVGIYQVVNPAFCHFLGLPKEAILGQDDARLFTPHQAARIRQADQWVLSSGAPSAQEEEAVGPDNLPLWLHVIRTPITQATGEVSGILTTVRNISARRMAEEALRTAHEGLEQEVAQRTQALRESETRLRIVTENLPAVVWMSDPLLTSMHFVSPAYEQIWGKSRESLLQDPQSLWTSIHPSDRSFVLKRILNSNGQPWEAEYRILHPDGTTRWIREQGAAFRDTHKQILFLIGCAFDVTPLKETERALSTAKQEAESANHAKSAFLATMSHEIRTPLNGITGMIELLQRSALSVEQRQQVETISKCSVVLMDILNDILDLSKIEAGQLVLERAPFSPTQLLLNLLEVMQPQARNKELDLQLNMDEKLPSTMLGDATRLRQVALNLIGNAIKFTPRGWVKISLLVHERIDDIVWVELAVQDQGIGIADEKLVHLFNPFTQADSSITRNYGGTGLGLAISKRLVEAMAGAISVTSIEGKGTHFRVTLPMQVAHTPLPADAFAPQETLALRPLQMLLVEDETVNQQVVCALLEDEGHHVDVANHGEEAVLMCQQRAYQVILMDLRMPKMDGLSATEQIRQQGMNQQTPIIALTADVLKSTLDRCLEVGMQQVLTKPIRLVQLNHALAHIGLPMAPPRPPAQALSEPAPEATESALPTESEEDTCLNLTRLRYLVSNMDQDHLLNIIQAFKTTSENCLSGMQQALENGDEGALRHTAHKLAGSAATLGLQRVMEMAKIMEEHSSQPSVQHNQLSLLRYQVELGFSAIAKETGLSLQMQETEHVASL